MQATKGSPILVYGHTNESLWAIIAGLKPTRNDKLLSICGSGDQAFALAEFAQEVVAVDRNYSQLSYAQRRRDALLAEDYENFFPLMESKNHNIIQGEKFNPDIPLQDRLFYMHVAAAIGTVNAACWSSPIRYFLGESNPHSRVPYGEFVDPDRIHRVRQNVSRVLFLQDNIFAYLRRHASLFTGAYLSNALDVDYCKKQDRVRHTQALHRAVPSGFVVYTVHFSQYNPLDLSPFKIDTERTKEAGALEKSAVWRPAIYCKI